MRLLVFLVWSQSVPHFKLHNIDQQQNILTKWLEKLYNCGFFFYSIFDLQMSNPDPLLPSLLERTPADELDLANQEERQLHRMHSLFSIYPIQQVSRENMIIASNSHWLSCKRENIKETDNVHCRGQLRALRPIYTARLCRMRQAYDRPTTWLKSRKRVVGLIYTKQFVS